MCKSYVDRYRECTRLNPVDVDAPVVALAAVDMQVSLTAKNLQFSSSKGLFIDDK